MFVFLLRFHTKSSWATKKNANIYFYQRVDLECPRERKMLVRERSRKQKCFAKVAEDDMYLDVKLCFWYANFAKGSQKLRCPKSNDWTMRLVMRSFLNGYHEPRFTALTLRSQHVFRPFTGSFSTFHWGFTNKKWPRNLDWSASRRVYQQNFKGEGRIGRCWGFGSRKRIFAADASDRLFILSFFLRSFLDGQVNRRMGRLIASSSTGFSRDGIVVRTLDFCWFKMFGKSLCTTCTGATKNGSGHVTGHVFIHSAESISKFRNSKDGIASFDV